MKRGFCDTPEEIEQIQLSLIRQASVARRISSVRSLSQTAFQLARRAIRRANPTLTQREVDLLFVALHYGEDLAAALRVHLAREET